MQLPGRRWLDLLDRLYNFLPVQLLFLHFRKYQLLLLFWAIIVATVTGNFASHFGAASLFLAPEYLGNINFFSMFLLGGCLSVFVMAWHITTFIVHSYRIPFIGATRHSFIIYCINNSLLPLLFLIFYSVYSIRFQWYDEHTKAVTILFQQLGFYLGILLVLVLSFGYFFSVGKDMLKTLLARITNPALVRELIPYDTLDYEYDLIKADTYISDDWRIESIGSLETGNPRLLRLVLRRHHRNALTATIAAFALLLLLGVFMEEPLLRLPAAGGFLLLFSIFTCIIGAVKYFLRSWEVIGWLLFAALFSWMVKLHVLDLRSPAYGLDYHTAKDRLPVYDYEHLKAAFGAAQYERDYREELRRLDRWKAHTGQSKPPLVVIGISGGGSRAGYWAFRCLQQIDSMSAGALYRNTVLITGASGGMIGGSYWRGVHEAAQDKRIKDPYDSRYQDNIGKDLLNALVFSFASVDLISPFTRVWVAGYAYSKDRGYALEQELIRNTEGILDKKIGDYRVPEQEGTTPALVMSGTIINDGKKLLIASRPVTYLTRPAYSLGDTATPTIDAVDFAGFFPDADPYNLRLATALRMNATFPFILPAVKLPSRPEINVMDAGLHDNFGMEVSLRYLYVFRDWIRENCSGVIFLQIRDTREYEILTVAEQNTLGRMLADPLFVIQNKWAAVQSIYGNYLKEYAPCFLDGNMRFVSMQYVPKEQQKSAALNFHLTQQEKLDISQSLFQPENALMADTMVKLLRAPDSARR